MIGLMKRRRDSEDSQEALARAEREARADAGNLSKVKRLVHLSQRHGYEHRGRSLEAWQELAVNSPPGIPEDAQEALVELDIRAVPVLIACLGSWRQNTRLQALSIIEDIGDGAEATIPAITRCLEKRPAEQVRAARALAGYGSRAAPVLPELGIALERCDASALPWVLRALGRIGPPAAPYADAIIAQLGAENASIREESLTALTGLGLSQERIFEALKARLEDPVTEVRCQAVKALSKLQRLRPQSVPLLIDLVVRDESRASAEAARALKACYDQSHLIAAAAAPILKQAEGPVPTALYKALGACEPEDLPLNALLDRLASEDVEGQVAIAKLLGRLNPDPALAVPALTEQYARNFLSDSAPAIVEALGEYGEDAASAVPALLELYEVHDPKDRARILRALGWIGHTGGGALELLIKESDAIEDVLRGSAGESLSLLGAEAVPAIIEALDRQIFKDGLLKALRDIGEEAAAATSQLIALLDATTIKLEGDADIESAPLVPDWKLRRDAIRTLRALGHGAAAAVSFVEAFAEDQEGPLRASAVLTLGDIDPAGWSIKTMRSALGAKSEKVRAAACMALGAQGPRAEAAVEDLTAALRDEDKRVRSKAAEALGEIGAGAARAIPALLTAMAGEARGGRGDYVAALSELIKDEQGVTALRQRLVHRDDDLRRCAADALGWAGAAAASAAPELVALLEDFAPKVRAAAADALGSIGRADPEVIGGLGRALGDAVSAVRCGAAMALSELGEAAIAAEDALVNALSNTDAELRASSAEALGAIGARSARAADALARALADPESAVRYQAGDALKALRAPAQQVEDAVLAAIAEEEAPDMVADFMETLAALSGGSERVAITFERAQNDPRREVRLAGARLAAQLKGQGGGDLEAEGAEDDVAEVVEDHVADGARGGDGHAEADEADAQTTGDDGDGGDRR